VVATVPEGHEIRAGDTRFVFTGDGLRDIRHRDGTMLAAAPTINLWRAPLDNDGIKGWRGQDAKPLGRWRRLGIDAPTVSVTARRPSTAGGVPLLHYDTMLACAGGRVRMATQYRVGADGILHVTHRFDIPRALDDLPRIGVRWKLQPGFEQFAWYGRGPHETYVDRRASGIVAVHRSSVSDQYVPYILPQDHGNLTDVRWLELGRDSVRLRVTAAATLEASASHYPHEVLTGAFHTYEIAPDPCTWLCLDVMQRGVGGASCGPDTLAQYRTVAGRHELAYTVQVIDA